MLLCLYSFPKLSHFSKPFLRSIASIKYPNRNLNNRKEICRKLLQFLTSVEMLLLLAFKMNIVRRRDHYLICLRDGDDDLIHLFLRTGILIDITGQESLWARVCTFSKLTPKCAYAILPIYHTLVSVSAVLTAVLRARIVYLVNSITEWEFQTAIRYF